MRPTTTPNLTHLALHVRDLAACEAFYREFCGLECVHERGQGAERVVWLAEPGRGREFIFVMLAGGPGRDQGEGDYSHFGFALDSTAAVDEVAARAAAAGCLAWPPRREPYPVGYYCGLRDPDGNFVEFSYGQPLGPGGEEAAEEAAEEVAEEAPEQAPGEAPGEIGV
jgi:catechol 2,3-dioxygenase-like lactoylglutathione lyase family enzyme